MSRKELLAQMGERMGAEHYGEERAEWVAAKAEQIIAQELTRRRWKETTLSVDWIAERLGLGTRGHANHLLYRRRKSGAN